MYFSFHPKHKNTTNIYYRAPKNKKDYNTVVHPFGGEGWIWTHGRSHVTGFQELKRCSALFRKLNIFCNFTYAFADISPTTVSRNYYSKWENYCQKLKKFHLESNIHLHMDNYHPFRNHTNSRTSTKWATVTLFN